MNLKNTVTFLNIYLIFISSFLYGNETGESKPLVYIQEMKKQKISNRLRLPVIWENDEVIQVKSPSEGMVTDVKIKIGQSVTRGDILMQLKHREPMYQQKYFYERALTDGIVKNIQVIKGTIVQKDSTLLEIFNKDSGHLKGLITLDDLPYLNISKLGQVKFKSQNLHGKVYPIKIIAIGASVHKLHRTIPIEMAFVEKKAKVPPGSLGVVTFYINEHDGHLVPSKAIFYMGSKTFLKVVEGVKNTIKSVPVSIKNLLGNEVEILEGIKDHQKVVVQSFTFLEDGEEVQIKK